MERTSRPAPFLLNWRRHVASEHGPTSATTRHVLLTLAIWMDGEGGSCFPSTAEIASATALSERAVCTHLEAAEGAGWLQRRRAGRVGRAWKHMEYQATTPKALNEVQQQAGGGTEGGSVRRSGGTERCSDKALKEVQSNSTKELSSISDDAFDRAWSLYPKRAGGNPKKAARRAWDARVRAGDTAEELTAGVQRYAGFIRAIGNEGTPYVKQGSTFFGPDEHWTESWEPPTRPDEHAPPQPVVVYD